MMGVELFVQVFLDSALLSACVFGTLGWQGRLMNCEFCYMPTIPPYRIQHRSCFLCCCPAGQFRLCIIPAFSRTPFE